MQRVNSTVVGAIGRALLVTLAVSACEELSDEGDRGDERAERARERSTRSRSDLGDLLAGFARPPLRRTTVQPLATSAVASGELVVVPSPIEEWRAVVTSRELTPGTASPFAAFDAPAVNQQGVVVVGARSGSVVSGASARGVYARDMSLEPPGSLHVVADVSTPVPSPNNTGATFFDLSHDPRMASADYVVALRAHHPPVWVEPLGQGDTTYAFAGTTGLYAKEGRWQSLESAVTAGGVEPGTQRFAVPQPSPGYEGEPLGFDAFDGSPSAALTSDGRPLVAFTGRYTALDVQHHGVYFRYLDDWGAPVVPIVTSTTSLPGLTTEGAPAESALALGVPSASGDHVVFTASSVEDTPGLAQAIYLAPLAASPAITTLVTVGDEVPGVPGDASFRHLGDAPSFDGRFVAFWGAWGDEARTLTLECPSDGDAALVASCRQQHPDGVVVEVPRRQGVFVHDVERGTTTRVAATGDGLTDLLYWSYDGTIAGSPFVAGADPPRWRATAFVALSSTAGVADVAFLGRSATYHAASARYGEVVDGVHLSSTAPGREPLRVLATGSAGAALDAEVGDDAIVSELRLSREALRGDWLVVQATVSSSEGPLVSGVYATRLDRAHAFRADFREPRGDAWWVEVGVDASGWLRRVEARVDEGDWVPLAYQAERRWGGSLYTPLGSVVTFRAVAANGTSVVSRPFRWPDAVPYDDEAYYPFHALFTYAKGNEGWVEVTVQATGELAGVDTRADFGAWQPLASTPWGTWAAALYVPDGSQVDFRARSTGGDVVMAGGYIWPR